MYLPVVEVHSLCWVGIYLTYTQVSWLGFARDRDGVFPRVCSRDDVFARVFLVMAYLLGFALVTLYLLVEFAFVTACFPRGGGWWE